MLDTTQPTWRTLDDATTRLERTIASIASARRSLRGTLPIAAAEAEMDDTEDHLDILDSKLRRALASIEAERSRAEAA